MCDKEKKEPSSLEEERLFLSGLRAMMVADSPKTAMVISIASACGLIYIYLYEWYDPFIQFDSSEKWISFSICIIFARISMYRNAGVERVKRFLHEVDKAKSSGMEFTSNTLSLIGKAETFIQRKRSIPKRRIYKLTIQFAFLLLLIGFIGLWSISPSKSDLLDIWELKSNSLPTTLYFFPDGTGRWYSSSHNGITFSFEYDINPMISPWKWSLKLVNCTRLYRSGNKLDDLEAIVEFEINKKEMNLEFVTSENSAKKDFFEFVRRNLGREALKEYQTNLSNFENQVKRRRGSIPFEVFQQIN